MIGHRFNKLVIIERAPRRNRKEGRRWVVRCDCGVEKIVDQAALKSGATGTCNGKGCKSTSVPKHGMVNSITYTSWAAMKARCTNPKATKYNKYGGAGITFDPAWSDFAPFLKDMGERPSKKHTIDRIDSRGNYTAENCRWALIHTQQANIAHNVRLTHNGETHHLSEWARRLNIPSVTISHRLLRGVSAAEALKPAKKRAPPMGPVTHAGRTLTLQQWAKVCGVSATAIRWRITQGWPLNRALEPKVVEAK